MRGGGRGGGGRVPYAAAEGADAAAIPLASRKLVQGLKGILADRSEAEIYATLLDCGMDPDVAVERLISQDHFHEVKRKRDKKKEIKAPQETRPRPFYKSSYRGSKAGSDRSGHFHSSLGDSTGTFKGPTKKETELHSHPNSIKDIPTEKISTDGHAGSNESPIVSSDHADAKSTLQPPSQLKHGWGGVPGRPSMADIVKMGRPQAKLQSISVASSTGMPTVGGSIISNATNHTSKDSQDTVLPSEVDHITTYKMPNGASAVCPASDDSIDVLPPGEGLEVPESVATVKPGPLTADVNKDGVEEDTIFDEIKGMSASNADGLTSSGPYTAPATEIQLEYTQIATGLNNDLIVETDDCQPDVTAFEHHRDSEGNMSITDKQFEQLTIHEEKKSKSSEDNPAVIIPDHLQVSNADCAHLTFGSFVSGTLDAPVSLKLASSDEEVAAVSDDHSIDQSDMRIHEHENKDTETPAADEHVTSTTKSDIENLDVTPVQHPELRTSDLIDVTNNSVYNISSTPDYATSSAVQPDSSAHTYLQENRQLQNISPLSSFMQGNIPNGLLPPTLPPLREFDPAFSLLLTNPPLATMVHGTPSSSMGNATVSTQPQENVNPGASSNPPLSQSQPSTNIASVPPLPQHLALHPYAQATLPLGYASMIGYPSLPQSYAYLPPAAFQQPYMNSGMFHQAAAAVPNSSVKYPLPQYKSNVSLASLPQPASLLSSYVGGFGTANSMPGNFALNQSTQSATAAPGFDGTMPVQYKDGNHFVSLQQSENPAMWMHGAGSRAMPHLAANALYGYGHQGGLRQGQMPSQFGAALGQPQPGLGHEHRNPSDGNLSAAAQANQMWPNSY
ncbi:hypothetical protein ABZP36_028489 [Zizania latifolia]